MTGKDQRRVYVLDDDVERRSRTVDHLTASGFEAAAFGSVSRFLTVLEELPQGCVLIQVSDRLAETLQVVPAVASRRPDLAAVIVSAATPIVETVDAIKSGRPVFQRDGAADRPIVDAISDALSATTRPPQTGGGDRRRGDVLQLLSPRELEVLRLLLLGHPNKSVAQILGISPRTVEVHRSRMMQRLGVRSFAEMIRLAVEVGLGKGIT
ncbi:MAG: LuxR C-terminal-related transcriptional regulator [Hyphomicrobiaceae bacterium]